MNDLSVKCLIALSVALLLGAAAGSAQTTTAPKSDKRALEKTPDTTTPAAAPLPLTQCATCKHAVPEEVQTSSKDAVTLYGPPDGKGAAVEYQLYVRMKPGAAWELAARGEIAKPGEQHPHCFANSEQIMVLVWCATPFGSMAEFSDTCK
ncbi:MAG: hypothetical protein L6Q97_25950 [Thermoanaerobaculia bacterium]|nr:hypothetical protein [Thermoanaerobaculia bacterium]